MTEPRRILVVDDVSDTLVALEAWLRTGAATRDWTVEYRTAASLPATQALLRDGAVFDLAFVDLGLGAGQPSGLGAIELLTGTGLARRVVVRSDVSEDGRRVLFVYAAFHWYPTLSGLMPKVMPNYRYVNRQHEADEFARAVREVVEHGRLPGPDMAAPFRTQAADPFTAVLKTPEDLLKWRALEQHDGVSAAAAYAGVTPGRFNGWLDAKYPEVWRLLDHARTSTCAGVEQYIVDPRAEGRRSRLAALHAFARSQSWFFKDPVVGRRFGLRG